MSATDELLPCPFCGGEAKVESWWSDLEECGVAIAACRRESYTNGYECGRITLMRVDERTAREDVIRAWNRRQSDECEVEYVSDWMGWHCKSCDALWQGLKDQPPRFCKECGRKVKR